MSSPDSQSTYKSISDTRSCASPCSVMTTFLHDCCSSQQVLRVALKHKVLRESLISYVLSHPQPPTLCGIETGKTMDSPRSLSDESPFQNFFAWVDKYLPTTRPNPEFLGPGEFLYASPADQARELNVKLLLLNAQHAHAEGRFADCGHQADAALRAAKPLGFESLEGRCEYWIGAGMADVEDREVLRQVRETWRVALQKIGDAYPVEAELATRGLENLENLEDGGSIAAAGHSLYRAGRWRMSSGDVPEWHMPEVKKREESSEAHKHGRDVEQLHRDARAEIPDRERDVASVHQMVECFKAVERNIGPTHGVSTKFFDPKKQRRHSFGGRAEENAQCASANSSDTSFGLDRFLGRGEREGWSAGSTVSPDAPVLPAANP